MLWYSRGGYTRRVLEEGEVGGRSRRWQRLHTRQSKWQSTGSCVVRLTVGCVRDMAKSSDVLTAPISTADADKDLSTERELLASDRPANATDLLLKPSLEDVIH